MAIWIAYFPLPPSQNDALMAVVGRQSTNKKGKKYYKGRMVKTAHHRKYIEQCLLWSRQNQESLNKVISCLLKHKKEIESSGRVFALRVDAYFVFHVERIITEHNKSHALDVDNRLKPCLDGLKKVLGIDDKYFYASNCEKVVTPLKEEECTMIRIELTKVKTLDQVKQMMK